MRSRFYTVDGVTKTLGEWCREFRLPYLRTYMRIERGMTFTEAITKPEGSLAKPRTPAAKEHLITIEGRTQSLHAWTLERGVSYSAVIKRVIRGQSPIDALNGPRTRPMKGRHGVLRGYNTWKNMLDRCHSPHHKDFRNYGARGIYVCQRWRDSFEAFLFDMKEPPQGSTLERMNNDGPYGPDNCRWATKSEQARNTRQNFNITIDGKTMCLVDWCIRTKISSALAYRRIAAGWPIEEAVSTLGHHRKRKTAD